MRKLLSILLISMLFGTSIAQKKYYIGFLEVLTMGPEFLTGDINNTLTSGAMINMADLGIFSVNHPSWIAGLSLGDFGVFYCFDPTPVEKNIMDNYAIVATIPVPIFGTIIREANLEKIRFSLWRPSIFLEYQPFIEGNQKISPFIRPAFSVNSLKSYLPDVGESKYGIGFKLKCGLDYRVKRGFAIRAGYGYGTLPNFDMDSLLGLRTIGGGAYHNFYVGLGWKMIP